MLDAHEQVPLAHDRVDIHDLVAGIAQRVADGFRRSALHAHEDEEAVVCHGSAPGRSLAGFGAPASALRVLRDFFVSLWFRFSTQRHKGGTKNTKVLSSERPRLFRSRPAHDPPSAPSLRPPPWPD